jgi:dienelactone hydrolase
MNFDSNKVQHINSLQNLSQIAYKKGHGERSAQLHPHYTYDEQLSDDDTVVAHHRYNPNESIIAFRGTDPHTWSRAKRDIPADIRLGMGNTSSDRFVQARRKIQDFHRQHPGRHITLTGHSLGGTIAEEIGRENHIDSAVFNPGRQLVGKRKTKESRAKHEVYRHADDLISNRTKHKATEYISSRKVKNRLAAHSSSSALPYESATS